MDRDALGTELVLVFLNGVVSGITPFVVMKVLGKGHRTAGLLQDMTSQRLLHFTFAAASSVAHQALWWLMARAGVNFWVDVWPMFIGDAIGALLMLYAFKLLLTQVKLKSL